MEDIPERCINNPGYDFTQKSYGMWAIPIDVGVKVIVFFAEENYGLVIG